MLYLTLELKGYKRLALNNIHHITIKPTEKLQLILGTNGSGKSSLLHELTPLPAASGDFLKDGYKVIEIEHRGHRYLLSSYFSPSQKHSFVKDSEEQNPGGTLAVQKELVKREFNVTQDVHDLMTGTLCFHTMGPGERRQWFTKLSDTNYTYAIGVYQRLKEKLRDVSGAIKINQARSVQEANKLLTVEQEKQLRTEIESCQQLLQNFFELKSSKTFYRNEIEKGLLSNEQALQHQIALYRRLRKQFLNFEGFTSVEDIDNALIDQQAKINTLNYTIDTVSKSIEGFQQTYDTLLKSNLTGSKDIESRLATIQTEIQALQSSVRLNIDVEYPENAQQALLTVRETLGDVFVNLESNKDRKYTKDTFDVVSKNLEAQKNWLKITENRQNELLAMKKEQEHHKEHGEIQCPQCSHRWYRGYDERVYKAILAELQELGKKYAAFETAIKESTEELEKIKTYVELYRVYTSTTRNWPILNPFWEYLSQTQLIFDEPRSVISVIETFLGDLAIQQRIQALKNEYGELVKIRALAQKDDEANLDKIKESITALNDQLFNQNQELAAAQNAIHRYRGYKEIVKDIRQIEIEINILLDQRETSRSDLVEAHRKETLNNLIQEIQIELSKKEQQLTRASVQKGVVENLQRQLERLESEETVLKVMVNELSPTDGLIARGLLGFINIFVQQMNSFIRKVWLYPMEIVPTKPDENAEIDLDYKFSVIVNNDYTVPDISKGSSAMREVIDLAFKIVCAKYLGLSESPLFLDEFGARFDPAHRRSAFSVITNLMAQSHFTQIYMVSHFEEFYGGMKNAEVMVLSDTNLSLPENCAFNKHVTMH